MLTFLRRIRKSLIESLPSRQAGGSARKYLLYAIGEILLVMIGILLALQVNNINEQRKAKKFEEKLIIELLKTIRDELPNMKRRIRGNEKVLLACETLLNHLEQDLQYNDTLKTHFGRTHHVWLTNMRMNAYENAKAYGLNFLEDSTRFLLTETYERNLPYIQAQEERWDRYFFNVASPILTKNFRTLKIKWGGPYDEMKPNNYNGLYENNEYLSTLRTTREFVIQRLKWQKLVNDNLIKLDSMLKDVI